MRKLLFTFIILIAFTATLQAEHFRMGVIGAAEFSERPSFCEFFDALGENTDLFPGLYWEVLFGRVGFGGTYLVRFLHAEPETGLRDWSVEWIGTIDLRFHFLKRCFIDPFIELALGCAGRVDITEAAWYEDHVDVLALSLFAQAGAGLAIRFDHFHVGAKLIYRMCNDPIPATVISEYPLQTFQASIFAGVSF